MTKKEIGKKLLDSIEKQNNALLRIDKARKQLKKAQEDEIKYRKQLSDDEILGSGIRKAKQLHSKYPSAVNFPAFHQGPNFFGGLSRPKQRKHKGVSKNEIL